MVSYPSGYDTIDSNRANWIHVGQSYEEDSALKIINNSLCAYSSRYLEIYNDTATNSSTYGLGSSYGYAIVVTALKHSFTTTSTPANANDSSCVIDNNTVNTGYWLQSNLTSITFKYPAGYIYCQPSNIITNNNLKGVEDTSGLGVLIAVSGVKNNISNNQIYRKTASIYSYVGFLNFEGPTVWDGYGSNGIVTNNFLDSPYINDTTLNENVLNITAGTTFIGANRWIVENNINQTGYLGIPITNSQMFLFGGSGYMSSPAPYGSGFTVANAATTSFSGSLTHGLGYKSNLLRISDSATDGYRFVGWQENLDKYMPSGSRIITLQMGVKAFATTSFDTADVPLLNVPTGIFWYLNNYNFTTNYLNMASITAALSADTNVINDASGPSTSLSTATLNSNLGGVLMLMTLDTTTAGPSSSDISDQFQAGKGYTFSTSLDVRYQKNGGVTHLYFSPVSLKYRW